MYTQDPTKVLVSQTRGGFSGLGKWQEANKSMLDAVTMAYRAEATDEEANRSSTLDAVTTAYRAEATDEEADRSSTPHHFHSKTHTKAGNTGRQANGGSQETSKRVPVRVENGYKELE